MIREATHKDIDAIYALCESAHSKSFYRAVDMDEMKTRRLIAKYVTQPSAFCWVSTDIKAVLAASIEEIPWSRKRCTEDIMFYCEQPGPGAALLRQYISWAKEQRVALYGLSVSFGYDLTRTHDLLERAGLKHVGGIFMEVVP